MKSISNYIKYKKNKMLIYPAPYVGKGEHHFVKDIGTQAWLITYECLQEWGRLSFLMGVYPSTALNMTTLFVQLAAQCTRVIRLIGVRIFDSHCPWVSEELYIWKISP